MGNMFVRAGLGDMAAGASHVDDDKVEFFMWKGTNGGP